MHALLMANAPFEEGANPHLEARLSQVQQVVGVDGGAATLLRLGIVPQVVTGDGDSLDAALRERLVQAGALVVPTPDQDYTDLDKALHYCEAVLGVDQVTVFGATGGRLDHSYSVFSTLIKYGRRFPIELVDAQASYFLVPARYHRHERGLRGRTVSLMAFGRVEGITTQGLRWPLDDDWLAPGERDGTLNELIEDELHLTVSSGNLVVMLHH